MNRVLFLSLQVSESASKGHLNPLIGVAQHVGRQGHEVAWMSLPRSMGAEDSAQVRSAGTAILPTPTLVEDIIPSAQELSRLALDPKRVWEAYRSFLLAPVPQLLDALCLTIQKFAPDAIAVDCMTYVGIIAAHRLGVPYLGVCAGLKILKDGPFQPAYMNDLSALLPLRAVWRLSFACLNACRPTAMSSSQRASSWATWSCHKRCTSLGPQPRPARAAMSRLFPGRNSARTDRSSTRPLAAFTPKRALMTSSSHSERRLGGSAPSWS